MLRQPGVNLIPPWEDGERLLGNSYNIRPQTHAQNGPKGSSGKGTRPLTPPGGQQKTHRAGISVRASKEERPQHPQLLRASTAPCSCGMPQGWAKLPAI